MPEYLTLINANSKLGRFVLVLTALATCGFVWYSVSLQIGDMLAESTSASDENVKEIADSAVRLAPRDPLALWLKAGTQTDLLTEEKIEESTELYQQAVRSSPYDFRWRIELGRAYERAGRYGEAAAALSKAIELAPNYAYPHWQLGNFYVRQGRPDAAIPELRDAAKNNFRYRDQVFEHTWQYLGQDTNVLEDIAGDDPDAIARLSLFLAFRDRADDAVRVWKKIPETEWGRLAETAKNVAFVLRGKAQVRQLLEFARWAGKDPDARFEAITNGGFESVVGPSDENFLGWHISENDSQIAVTLDREIKRSGSASLRIAFKGYSKAAYDGTSQVVAVEPESNYTLRYWIRTENLKSAGPPTVEILSTGDNKLLAASNAFPIGTNPWREEAVTFTVPSGRDGVVVRISRAFCGENCPIFGTAWVDDVSLSR